MEVQAHRQGLACSVRQLVDRFLPKLRALVCMDIDHFRRQQGCRVRQGVDLPIPEDLDEHVTMPSLRKIETKGRPYDGTLAFSV